MLTSLFSLAILVLPAISADIPRRAESPVNEVMMANSDVGVGVGVGGKDHDGDGGHQRLVHCMEQLRGSTPEKRSVEFFSRSLRPYWLPGSDLRYRHPDKRSSDYLSRVVRRPGAAHGHARAARATSEFLTRALRSPASDFLSRSFRSGPGSSEFFTRSLRSTEHLPTADDADDADDAEFLARALRSAQQDFLARSMRGSGGDFFVRAM